MAGKSGRSINNVPESPVKKMIFSWEPEVAAEAIYSVIQRPVNELWVGKSTIQSILGQVFFPRLLDRLMVKKAWEGQFIWQKYS